MSYFCNRNSKIQKYEKKDNKWFFLARIKKKMTKQANISSNLTEFGWCPSFDGKAGVFNHYQIKTRLEQKLLKLCQTHFTLIASTGSNNHHCLLWLLLVIVRRGSSDPRFLFIFNAWIFAGSGFHFFGKELVSIFVNGGNAVVCKIHWQACFVKFKTLSVL